MAWTPALVACALDLTGGTATRGRFVAAGLLWCLCHPVHLMRRRRQSQNCRRVPDKSITAGVYRGSALLQYYARGVRRADRMLPEEASVP